MLFEGHGDTWTGETRLLLEDKIRIEKLVSGQIMTPRLPSHDWSSNNSRYLLTALNRLDARVMRSLGYIA